MAEISGISGRSSVVKATWGTKRTCQNCAARFYDLNKSPIKCPKCCREHDREDFVKVRRGRASAAATSAAAAAAAALAAAKALAAKKKVEDAVLDDAAPDAGTEYAAIEDTDDLADEAEEIEVQVDDDKGERHR